VIVFALIAAILVATTVASVKIANGHARRRVARDGARLDAVLRQLVRDEQRSNQT
jgi:hypothetical protein